MLKTIKLITLLLALHTASGQNQALVRQVLDRVPFYTNEQLIYAYDTLVMEYRDVRPSQALGYAHAGLHAAVAVKDSSNIAYFYTLLGVLHKNIADIDSAVHYYNKAIAIQTATDFIRGIAGNYNNIATAYKLAGKFPQSLEYYRKALEIMRDKYNDEENTHIIYQNMAELYVENNKPGLAWEILKEEEQYHTLKKNLAGIAHVNLSKAMLLQTDSAKEAIPYAEKAAQFYLQLKRVKDYCQALILKGKLFFTAGNEARAFADIGKAIIESRQNNLPKHLADGLLEMAEIYHAKNDYPDTKRYLLECIAVYKQLGTPMPLLRCYKLLADAEDRAGNHQQAYSYLKIFDKLNDSLNNVKLRNEFNQLQIKYNVSEKEKQIIRLKDSTEIQLLQNQRQQLALDKQRNRNIYLSLIILGVLLSAILFIYRYKKQQRLSKKLQQALNEREILLKEVHHRVKNNLQIINSLLNLQNELGNKQSVQDVVQLTQDRIHTMSMIHEKLYRSENLEDISLQEYMSSLCQYYEQSYDLPRKNIRIETNITNTLPVSLDQLITLGLFVNELLINSIKYAFDKQQAGLISIHCYNEKEIITFTVADNGKGLPDNFNEKKVASLGMQLIEGFAQQLKAKLKIQGQPGTSFSLTFKPADTNGSKNPHR